MMAVILKADRMFVLKREPLPRPEITWPADTAGWVAAPFWVFARLATFRMAYWMILWRTIFPGERMEWVRVGKPRPPPDPSLEWEYLGNTYCEQPYCLAPRCYGCDSALPPLPDANGCAERAIDEMEIPCWGDARGYPISRTASIGAQ